MSKRKIDMTDNDVRDDVRKSLQSMRQTVARLQQDYAYLDHAQSAGDDLVCAIDAFDRELTNDLDQHQEKLTRVRTMHGGG